MNTPSSLPADTHIHTALCQHAEGMPLDYAKAAVERGIPEITVTDHIPAPDGYDAASRMPIQAFPAYLESVATAARAFPDRVRLGLEADYYPGCETCLHRVLDSAPFDLVLGSVHFIGDWGFDNSASLHRWREMDIQTVWTRYMDLIRGLVALKSFDALSHFDLPKKFGHRLPERDMASLVSPVLDVIADAGLPIELNTSGLRKPVGEIYPALSILKLMRARDIPILFGSDAHRPSEVGHAFEAAVQLAREAGYTQYMRFRGRKAMPAEL